PSVVQLSKLDAATQSNLFVLGKFRRLRERLELGQSRRLDVRQRRNVRARAWARTRHEKRRPFQSPRRAFSHGHTAGLYRAAVARRRMGVSIGALLCAFQL